MVIVTDPAARRRPLTLPEMQALADTMRRWMALIDAGEMEAGPVFRHELAGALTVLEVALGHDPSLIQTSLLTDDEHHRCVVVAAPREIRDQLIVGEGVRINRLELPMRSDRRRLASLVPLAKLLCYRRNSLTTTVV
jgi:hypothetical protein